MGAHTVNAFAHGLSLTDPSKGLTNGEYAGWDWNGGIFPNNGNHHTLYFYGSSWKIYTDQPKDVWANYAAFDWWITYHDSYGWHDVAYCGELGDRDSATLSYNGGTKVTISCSGCSLSYTPRDVPEGTCVWRFRVHPVKRQKDLDQARVHLTLNGLGTLEASPKSHLKGQYVRGLGDSGLPNSGQYTFLQNVNDNRIPGDGNCMPSANWVSTGTPIYGNKQGTIQPSFAFLRNIVNLSVCSANGISGTVRTFDADGDPGTSPAPSDPGTFEKESKYVGIGKDSSGFFIVRNDESTTRPNAHPEKNNYMEGYEFYAENDSFDRWICTEGGVMDYSNLAHEFEVTDPNSGAVTNLLKDVLLIPADYEGIFYAIPGYEGIVKKIPGVIY